MYHVSAQGVDERMINVHYYYYYYYSLSKQLDEYPKDKSGCKWHVLTKTADRQLTVNFKPNSPAR